MPYRIENGRARCLLCHDDVDNRAAAKVAHDNAHVAHNAHLRRGTGGGKPTRA